MTKKQDLVTNQQYYSYLIDRLPERIERKLSEIKGILTESEEETKEAKTDMGKKFLAQAFQELMNDPDLLNAFNSKIA